jgi:hypothetical protein
MVDYCLLFEGGYFFSLGVADSCAIIATKRIISQEMVI